MGQNILDRGPSVSIYGLEYVILGDVYRVFKSLKTGSYAFKTLWSAFYKSNPKMRFSPFAADIRTDICIKNHQYKMKLQSRLWKHHVDILKVAIELQYSFIAAGQAI